MSGSLWGSPPRMRGKVGRNPHIVGERGITPAYAGKRHTGGTTCFCRKDHPRVCGEKAFGRASPRGRGGSPPRMRGKGKKTKSIRPRIGITPAYAGKSPLETGCCIVVGDHPRVCGERSRSAGTAGRITGSPPRMRGKVVRLWAAWPLCGITPAYAGKSHFGAVLVVPGEDHPRVCGEKFFDYLMKGMI